MNIIHPFLAGCVFMANLVVALLFARFYRRTHDRLFIVFALAFAVLAFDNALLLIFQDAVAGYPTYLYSIRLIAFLCILAAILDKNRKYSTI